MDFFKSMQLLALIKNKQISNESNVEISFRVAKEKRFFYSVIERIDRIKNHIIVYINASSFLPKRYAIDLSNVQQTKIGKTLVDYFINQFIWLYYDSFKLEYPVLSSLNSSTHLLYQEQISSLLFSRYSIESLETVLSYYSSVPCKVKLFLSQWVRKPLNRRVVQLNRTFLGHRILVGSRGINIIIGPLNDNYVAYLPGRLEFNKMVKFLKTYLPLPLISVIKIKIDTQIINNCRLYSIDNKSAYYLGWTSYLNS